MRDVRIYQLATSLSVAGVILSFWLLNEEAVIGSEFCEIGGAVSCSKVIMSEYSHFLGLPIALYGLLWFIIASIISVSAIKYEKTRRVLFYWGIIGLIGIFALNYVEFMLIGAFCILCGFAHLLGALIFALAYIGVMRG